MILWSTHPFVFKSFNLILSFGNTASYSLLMLATFFSISNSKLIVNSDCHNFWTSWFMDLHLMYINPLLPQINSKYFMSWCLISSPWFPFKLMLSWTTTYSQPYLYLNKLWCSLSFVKQSGGKPVFWVKTHY